MGSEQKTIHGTKMTVGKLLLDGAEKMTHLF